VQESAFISKRWISKWPTADVAVKLAQGLIKKEA
jgi:hypothetical protein